MVELLSDSDVVNDHALGAAWISSSSFCLANHEQLNRKETLSLLKQIPKDLKTGHYGVFTSGSTGNPRLVIGSKRRSGRLAQLVNSAQMGDAVVETICALPISYSYAFVNQWVWARVMERRFLATPGFSQPDVLQQALRKANHAMICLVASQVPLIRQYFDQESYEGVIRVNFAGERFPQRELPYIRKIFPNAKIFNNYGCTEAMPRLTVRNAEDSEDASNIGRPLPDIELDVNTEGKLKFRSPYGAVASIGLEGVRRIDDYEWIETGDFAEPAPGGTWRLKGRTNEVFKRFGEKVSVAQVVVDLRASSEGAILGYADDDANGEPGWVLVLSPSPNKEEVREMLRLLRSQYSRPHWPLRIESMDSLLRLPNGKIDIQALKDAENKKLHWRQRI